MVTRMVTRVVTRMVTRICGPGPLQMEVYREKLVQARPPSPPLPYLPSPPSPLSPSPFCPPCLCPSDQVCGTRPCRNFSAQPWTGFKQAQAFGQDRARTSAYRRVGERGRAGGGASEPGPVQAPPERHAQCSLQRLDSER